MNSSELYFEFERRIKNTDNEDEFSISEIHSILNEAQRIYFRYLINSSPSSYVKDQLRSLKCVKVSLEKLKSLDDCCIFKYPEDYYHRINQTAIISNKCGPKEAIIYPVNGNDLQESLKDPHYNPSYNWSETLASESKEGFIVYSNDFTIDEVFLDYYKKPEEISFTSCTTDEEYSLKGRIINTNCYSWNDQCQYDKILDIATIIAMNPEDVNYKLQKYLNF